MLGCPKPNNRSFQVSVYNRNVRQLVNSDESHEYYEDHWAECHRYHVFAETESEARSIVQRKFPPEEGFVIEDLFAEAA